MKKWISLLAAALLLVSVIASGLAETADETADLLVVGAGPAGLSAAVSAVENGAEKVIVIEKTGKTGGNLNVTSGTLVGADTIIQREDGLLEDSVDMLYQDMIDTGSEHGGRPNSNLLYKYSELVGPAVDWLWENGLKDCEFTTVEEGHKAVFAPEHKLYSYPRSYKPKPIDSERYKSATHEVLDKLVAEHADKIEIVFNTEAKHLHANDQGQIVTVEAVDADGNTVFFTSRHGVVMATGGYAANQKMMSYFKPTASGIISSSLPGADGYGMRMVQEVGGDIAEYAMDIFPTITMGLPNPDNPTTGRIMSTKTAFAGGIWVNLNGERFVNETNADIYVREKALENQPEASMYEVYTDKIHDDLLEIPAHNNMMAGFFDLDAGKPYIVEADSLEELAEKLNLPAENLIATVEAYNEHVASGEPDEFGRVFVEDDNLYNAARNAIEGDKYYAVKQTSMTSRTIGGVQSNTKGQAVDENGTPIPGLYVAGEMVFIFGNSGMGGSGVTGAVAFGRYCGEMAMTLPMAENYQLIEATKLMPMELFEKEAVEAEVRFDMSAALADGTYTATVDGQEGAMTVETIIADGKISAVTIIEQHETESIAAAALESLPQAIVAEHSVNIDTVSGATLTSNRILDAVTQCLTEAAQ